MDLAPFAALVLINKWLVDLLRMWLPTDPQNKYMQPLAGVVGIAVAFLFAESSFGNGIDVWEGQNLGSLDPLGVVIYGLCVAAGGGVVHNVIAGRNPTRT